MVNGVVHSGWSRGVTKKLKWSFIKMWVAFKEETPVSGLKAPVPAAKTPVSLLKAPAFFSGTPAFD